MRALYFVLSGCFQHFLPLFYRFFALFNWFIGGGYPLNWGSGGVDFEPFYRGGPPQKGGSNWKTRAGDVLFRFLGIRCPFWPETRAGDVPLFLRATLTTFYSTFSGILLHESLVFCPFWLLSAFLPLFYRFFALFLLILSCISNGVGGKVKNRVFCSKQV